jgi:hypothetical protein
MPERDPMASRRPAAPRQQAGRRVSFQPRGGSKITLAYIALAPAGCAAWLTADRHWNLLLALAFCYGIELAASGLFSFPFRG